MTTKEAITLFKYYLQSNHKQRTLHSYRVVLDRFAAIYAQRSLDAITPDEIFHFLENMTQNLAKSTRRLRYAQVKAFYNFIIDLCSLNMRNPCNTPLLSKSFKAPKQPPFARWPSGARSPAAFSTGPWPSTTPSAPRPRDSRALPHPSAGTWTSYWHRIWKRATCSLSSLRTLPAAKGQVLCWEH